MNNIKVSIIIPVYNTEQYLRRCIESVINQTLKEIEIILVDDGSTDNSPDICDEYAKKDSRIVVIHKKNGGLSDARNAGIKIAKGQYFGFVDADDFVKENMFEVLLSVAIDNDCDMVNCGHFEVKEDGTVLCECTDTHGFTPNELVHKDDLSNRIKEIHKDNLLWFTWRNLYKKEFLNEHNITYCEEDVVEDSLFNLDCLLNNPRIVFIGIPLYYYVMTDNSLTRSKGKNGYVRRLENTYEHKVTKYKEYKIKDYKNDFYSYTLNHTFPLLMGNIIQLNDPKFEIEELLTSKMIDEAIRAKWKVNVNLKNKLIYFIILKKKKTLLKLVVCLRKCAYKRGK